MSYVTLSQNMQLPSTTESTTHNAGNLERKSIYK